MKLIKSKHSGFTLIELAIVVAMIGIMASISIWQAQAMLPQIRTKSAAREFAKWLDSCRMLAVRTNKECKVTMLTFDPSPTVLSAGNAGAYSISLGNSSVNSSTWDILPEDTYADASDDLQSVGLINIGVGATNYLRHVSIGDWGSGIGGPYNGTQDSMVFSPRGYLLNPATDFNTQGFIEISFVNKYARDEGRSEDFIVMIARSGMVRLDNTVGRRYGTQFSGTAYDASEAP